MSEWKQCRLGDVCIKIGSGATPKGGSNSYKGGQFSLIRSQNVLDFCFSMDGLVHINEEQASKLSSVEIKKHDILLNITGDSVARACIVPESVLPARVNQHVSIIRVNDGLADHKYILYYLQYSKPKLLQLASAGATRNALTKGMISDYTIRLPSLPTQRKIASILSALDDKIELNNRMNKNLEEQARAIFKSWFVDNDNIDREKCRLDKYFDISIGHTPPRKESEWFSNNDNDVQWASVTDLGKCGIYINNSSEQLTREAIQTFRMKIAPVNTVLVSFKLTVGRIAITNREMATNEAIAHIKTNNNLIVEYLYLYLDNFDFKTLGNTSSIGDAINSKIIIVMDSINESVSMRHIKPHLYEKV